MTINDVSEPALLEKLAEECSELSAACLHLACIERGEFPKNQEKGSAVSELLEEVADVSLATLGVSSCDWWDETVINGFLNKKRVTG